MFFCPRGKKSQFTPYNHAVKLLIIYSRAEIYIYYYIYYILNLYQHRNMPKNKHCCEYTYIESEKIQTSDSLMGCLIKVVGLLK
jgi:hypothetical protein